MILSLLLAAAPPLLPADAGFDTVQVRPRDPFTADAGAEVRLGYQLFSDTAKHAAPLTVNDVSCKNCHLNAGQKEGALPLVGVAAVYPQPNKRAGRDFTLEDRVIGCLLRSSDAANSPAKLGGGRHENLPAPLLTPETKQVKAIAAYLRWLSDGYPAGAAIPWRGKNEITKAARIPVEQLDPKKGQALFEKTCVACHAIDGQGVPLGDFKPGPLWGPRSWNDGAGLARIYTLAGYLRLAMPYLAPGSLTDEEAQQIAAYLCSKPRPSFAEKGRDYLVEPLPPDAVYYPPRAFKKPAAPGKATP